MRLGRSMVGALGGLLWGAGVAVLIQQYRLWPLDPLLFYGLPVAAALISGWWARRRARRARPTTAALALAAMPLLPALALAAQPACEVQVSTVPQDESPSLLSDTSPRSPFEVDPEVDDIVFFTLSAEGADEAAASVWVEIGGIAVPQLTREGVISDGTFSQEYHLNEGALDGLAGSPGIYHVAGSIEGVCSGEGYIAFAGNPLAGPIGQSAAAAVAIGLAITVLAGRPTDGPAPAPTTTRLSASRLRPDGRPVAVDGVTVRSPGLEGTVEVHPADTATLERVAGWTDATREALDHHHMRAERVIEFGDTVETLPGDSAGGVSTHHGEPGVQLDLPGPPPDSAQVVLASDESGVMSWNFPRSASGQIQPATGQTTSIYRIPRFVPPVDPATLGRGLVRAVGPKVVTSVAFPLLDPVFGEIGERFAAAWEAHRRPYRFRSFTPDDYAVEPATEPDWSLLAGGRSLLFVHGTFSRAHTAFAGMARPVLAEIHDRYQGRVFAFDHFTLSDDPRRNVEWFLDHLPTGVTLDLDIVCHSRGGLVSRILAEKADELARRDRSVTVSAIAFVASPNAGTVLAEPAFLGDLVDSYSNMLNFLPGPHVVDVLEGIVTVVKHIAVAAVAGLDGLAAMRPGGEFLRWLNTGDLPPARYLAVTADYEPSVAGWRRVAINRLLDGIFHEANDLVVPTIGTYAANGSTRFPIAEPHELTGGAGVDHTGYFADPGVGRRLLEWLQPASGPR